jgi:co-chaperonin GroES (HSP10)
MSFRSDEQYVKEHFPDVSPRVKPFGERVLVQLKVVRNKSAGGIVLVEETRDVNRENNVLARVVSLGPLAYHNRETQTEWPEGTWVKPGDVAFVPKWGGFRVQRKVPGTDEVVTFALFKDFEIIAGPECDFDELDQVL